MADDGTARADDGTAWKAVLQDFWVVVPPKLGSGTIGNECYQRWHWLC